MTECRNRTEGVLTQHEVADMLGISPNRVAQYENRALVKMRKVLRDNPQLLREFAEVIAPQRSKHFSREELYG